jgi:hypothetical protein
MRRLALRAWCLLLLINAEGEQLICVLQQQQQLCQSSMTAGVVALATHMQLTLSRSRSIAGRETKEITQLEQY